MYEVHEKQLTEDVKFNTFINSITLPVLDLNVKPCIIDVQFTHILK